MDREDDGGRRGQPAVTGLLVATVVLAVVALALGVVAWPHLDTTDAYPLLALSIAAVVYAALGTLILRRVRNLIGWILLLEGFGIALLAITSLYAVIGFARGGLAAADIVGLSSEVLFVPVVLALAAVVLLFPTGRLPSPRWRPVVVIAAVLSGITLIATVVTPRDIALPAPGGVSLTYPNPLGLSFLRDVFIGTLNGLSVVSIALLAAAAASLVVRFRSGDPELRQQIKWLVLAAGAFVVVQLVLTICLATLGTDAVVTTVIGFISAALALFGLPVAIGIAILKYRLYEIDVIINRAVVYTLLAAAVTGVYVAIVAGVGALVGSRWGPALTLVAAVAVAVSFQPLRRRAERVANRIVYGERASPYQVLSSFADAMARTMPLEEQLDQMVSLLANGTGATRVEVWIRVGDARRAVAVWPPVTGEPAADRIAGGVTFPVLQGDEPLGEIVLAKPPNEPLSPTEAALAEHVASQAGLVLRNVRLTAELRQTIEELRASRRRLIDAQDTERRKLERNLHDGAQQQLVALGVQLSLLERLARQVPDADRVTAAIPPLQAMATDALDDLRDLARGIYPPLLADRGLAAALDAQARKAAVPTTVDADGVGRYDQQTEAAVYFCTLEALQNVAKYAGAASAVVRLRSAEGWLTFEVQDDGAGFEPADASGSGIQGMVDRLDAIGGSLELQSSPGAGTLVRGRIPAMPVVET